VCVLHRAAARARSRLLNDPQPAGPRRPRPTRTVPERFSSSGYPSADPIKVGRHGRPECTPK
jgi:hypothetical protein